MATETVRFLLVWLAGWLQTTGSWVFDPSKPIEVKSVLRGLHVDYRRAA